MINDDDALSIYSESLWRSRWQEEAREHLRKPAEHLLVKNADEFCRMLKRRGYDPIIATDEHGTSCTVASASTWYMFGVESIRFHSIAEIAENLDKVLAGGQHHMQHECGFPLLRETKNTGEHETLAYRAACDGPTSKSALECPQCQQYVQDDSVQEINDIGH